MVDSTITSINASSTPLGYTIMSSSSAFASIVAHISTISTSTTCVGGTDSLRGVGGGGSPSGAPLSLPPSNLVLNTILQNMGQLHLQLTNLASTSIQSSLLAYYRKSPLDMTILNTILSTTVEPLKFDRFNGDGYPNVHIDSFYDYV